MKKAAKNNYLKEVQSTVEDLLSKLNVTATVEVTEEKPDSADAKVMADKEQKQFKAVIKTEESGLLIGHHGETINSLQLLIGVMLYKKLGEWVRVLIDIGDYRKMREESIKDMVNRIIDEVLVSGKPVELPYLSPLERRMVHMMLSTHASLTSESSGTGRDRRVAIKPR